MSVVLNTTNIETVNNTEALWSLIVNQKKSVQKTLATRLSALLSDEKREAQERYVKDTMSSALTEVREAHKSGRQLPDARCLFDELDN
ncbi:MAG: hypothetical protein IKQ72_07635 [Bacteroidaceae bacterium]|nr:hypothetical protein [Bacteroidaceae bacterium]